MPVDLIFMQLPPLHVLRTTTFVNHYNKSYNLVNPNKKILSISVEEKVKKGKICRIWGLRRGCGRVPEGKWDDLPGQIQEWIISLIMVWSVSRMPSVASSLMLRMVFSTPLTRMPSPP